MTIINIKLKYCKNSILKFYKYAILKADMKKVQFVLYFTKDYLDELSVMCMR